MANEKDKKVENEVKIDAGDSDSFMEGNSRIFAAIAYIPLIGWILPLFLKRDDEFCQFHGKQGFVVSIISFLVGITVAILRTELFEIILVLFYFFLFAGLFIYGFFVAYNNKEKSIPFIKEISDRIFGKFKI